MDALQGCASTSLLSSSGVFVLAFLLFVIVVVVVVVGYNC